MPDLERILQNTPGTLSQQWYEDGAAVDPGTVTVGITRADGTVLVAAGAATTGTGTGPRTYNLTTTHTALLDSLTVTWTSTLKGTLVSYVQVAGGFVFSIAELRALPPFTTNTTLYPTAKLVEMRILVEQAFEAELGYALVPRYKRETFTPEGGIALWSRVPLAGNVPGTGIPFVTTIRSVSIAGVTVTPSLVIPDTVGFYYDPGWGNVRRSVTIGFENGAQYPPERIKSAALFEARTRLIQRNSPTDDRTITQAFDGGTTVLQQPGRGGKSFYLPESDAVIDEFGLTVGVA